MANKPLLPEAYWFGASSLPSPFLLSGRIQQLWDSDSDDDNDDDSDDGNYDDSSDGNDDDDDDGNDDDGKDDDSEGGNEDGNDDDNDDGNVMMMIVMMPNKTKSPEISVRKLLTFYQLQQASKKKKNKQIPPLKSAV
uniref:Uncharacterized protein n=1 Tax=Biomphalaria glabrata TaxID=6526 RepID=A0A2C9M044_BIOGL